MKEYLFCLNRILTEEVSSAFSKVSVVLSVSVDAGKIFDISKMLSYIELKYPAEITMPKEQHSDQIENEQKLEELILKYKEELERSKNNGHIDGRINNGRKAETRICELLTDTTVFNLMKECHQKVMGFAIRVSGLLKKFLSAFSVAFYETKEIEETDEFGKVAHIHRVAESNLGTLVGCGLRALQKGIAWLRTNVAREDNEREYLRHWDWNDLKNEIKAILCLRIPEVIPAN